MSPFKKQLLKRTQKYKGTILFDPFWATGHINAFQLLARWLFDNGYRIVFAGPTDPKLINDNYELYHVSPFLFEPAKYEYKQKGLLKYLLDNVYESRYKKTLQPFQQIASEYDKLMEEVNPDLILLDDHYAYKALFYQRYKIDIITISVLTLPLMSWGTPPFQTNYVPNGTKLSASIIQYLWFKNRVKQCIKELIVRIRCLGITDLKLLRKLCPNSTFTFDTNRCFGVGIAEAPMIAIYPKALDFVHEFSGRNVFHFGRLSNQLPSKIEDHRLLSIINRASRENLQGNRKALVYCSLGTVTASYLPLCHSFFKKISSLAAFNQSIVFILNVGKSYDISQLGKTPSNLSVFSYVPQAELLQYVDLMINHGGINTIKECIHENVPMLTYPLSPEWDQPGNAARVVYHQLGLMGNIRRDTVKKMNVKLHSLLSRLEQYKENLREFRERIEGENALEEAKILSTINESINKRKSTNNFFYHDAPTEIKQNSC